MTTARQQWNFLEIAMEPGPMEISVGSSSSDIRSTAKLKVIGTPRVIKDKERAFLSEATLSS